MLLGMIPPAIPRFRRARAGAFYGTGQALTTRNNVPVVADTIYAFPIFIPESVSLNGIYITVGTPVIGVTGRIALYTCSQTLPEPQNLIVGSIVDNDFNAAANTTYALVVNQRVPAGVLMCCAKFNGAAQPQTVEFAGVPPMRSEFGQFMGSSNAGSATGLNTGISFVRATLAAPYLDPWPASFTPGSFAYGFGTPGSPAFSWDGTP